MYIKLNKKYAQLHAPTTQTQFHVARKLKPLVDGAYFPPDAEARTLFSATRKNFCCRGGNILINLLELLSRDGSFMISNFTFNCASYHLTLLLRHRSAKCMTSLKARKTTNSSLSDMKTLTLQCSPVSNG